MQPKLSVPSPVHVPKLDLDHMLNGIQDSDDIRQSLKSFGESLKSSNRKQSKFMSDIIALIDNLDLGHEKVKQSVDLTNLNLDSTQASKVLEIKSKYKDNDAQKIVINKILTLFAAVGHNKYDNINLENKNKNQLLE